MTCVSHSSDYQSNLTRNFVKSTFGQYHSAGITQLSTLLSFLKNEDVRKTHCPVWTRNVVGNVFISEFEIALWTHKAININSNKSEKIVFIDVNEQHSPRSLQSHWHVWTHCLVKYCGVLIEMHLTDLPLLIQVGLLVYYILHAIRYDFIPVFVDIFQANAGMPKGNGFLLIPPHSGDTKVYIQIWQN